MPPAPHTLRLALECGPATLDTAVALGVHAVPIEGAHLLARGVAATLQPLRERGLVPCQVGAFDFNPLHPDAVAREAGAARIRTLITLAAEAGCGWIAFSGGSKHPDCFGGSDPANLGEAALDEAAAVLAPLAALAARHGVRLTLEPHIRTILATPERAAALAARVGHDALRITLDVTNYYGALDCLAPDALLERCRRTLAGVTGLAHLKEITLLPGFHIHAGLAPMGAGRTDWTRVVAIAAELVTSDGWVLVEHCASAEEATASIALVRAAAAACGAARA